MRMLLNVVYRNSVFNNAVKDGAVGAKMERILEAIRPEAAYFTEQDGCRSTILIVDVSDASRIPALAEPWFLIFNASVQLRIVMSPEELKLVGLEELGKKWSQ